MFLSRGHDNTQARVRFALSHFSVAIASGFLLALVWATIGANHERHADSDFRTNRFDPALSAEQRREIERLESIGYLAGSEVSRARGVTFHDRSATDAGWNFYTSGHAPEAVLMDMDGQVLHRWSYDFWRVWPDFPVPVGHPGTRSWRRAHLFENGDMLAIFAGNGLIKLDRNSNLIWANPCRAHHDLQVMPNGEIYVLTREARMIPRLDPHRPILEDFVSILGPDGRERRRVSLLECLENSPYREAWRRTVAARGHVLGANTLEVLDGRFAEKAPAFRAGNVLTSFLLLDAIAVVDLERRSVVWGRTGSFVAQHDPKILDNGNILLFDNLGSLDESRVLETHPETGRVVWRYQGTEDSPFYSETCGTAERLRNGNTLITESKRGRAFEVTHDQRIVWEFYNPYQAGRDDEFIAILWDLVRVPRGYGLGCPSDEHGVPSQTPISCSGRGSRADPNEPPAGQTETRSR